MKSAIKKIFVRMLILSTPYIGIHFGVLWRSWHIEAARLGWTRLYETGDIKALGYMDLMTGNVYIRQWSGSTVHHELRHVKNSEFGKLPVAMDELSARVASELHMLRDTCRLNEIDSLVRADGWDALQGRDIAYDVMYYVPVLDTMVIDVILMSAVVNWKSVRHCYQSERLFQFCFPLACKYIRSAHMRPDAMDMTVEEKIDSVFTFGINDGRVNMIRMASPAVRARVLEIMGYSGR